MKKQAVNPYLPSWEYIPDGEPRLFGERVYVYGSHDRFGGHNFCLNDYVCWSAPADDLSDWRYEGVIWKRTDDPVNRDGKAALPAPDCIQGPDGRYYLYYFLGRKSLIGVAVCDEPAGKYEFYGHVHYPDGQLLGHRKGDTFQFDPGVFVEDGKVYLYTGWCPAAYEINLSWGTNVNKNGATVTVLEPDMVTIREAPRMIVPGIRRAKHTEFARHPFFEASSMRKIQGKYYFIYSSHQGHELCYAVSDRPDGDFHFGGTLVSNGDIGLNGHVSPRTAANFTGNTHGSILELNGKYYVFYHRQTNRSQYSRQACAEELVLEKTGNFRQAEMTSCGLNGGPLEGRGTYEARIACNLQKRHGNCFYLCFRWLHPFELCFKQSGKDREDSPDQYISCFGNGCRAGFKYFRFENAQKITVEIRGMARGKLFVTDDMKKVARIPVTPSLRWKKAESRLKIGDGVKPLYFIFVGKGKFDFRSFTLE
ncbi:hypothetical protein B5F07_11055 [Lachnoclostridium sp. An169]|uniref:family 43 glycosylhydrolase n=1 Tax=Lachnoclostridium sp. An169 TaxID=1965569 RepID=UPI000B398B6D|nr:family 43 glycosylhydrolase [Lachnoclostridium sp. An169]OUP83217.1 hypothetical protein B5F07_11055 [Lachnoclostridium sp. An169]